MYWLSQGFVFRKTNSFIHALDPRVRLLMAVELFILAIVSDTIFEVGTIFGGFLVIALIAKFLKTLLRTLTLSVVFGIIIALLNYFISKYTLVDSVVLGLKVVAIFGSISTFFLSTSPDELQQIMEWFHFPTDLVFAFVTAIRFVPVLMLDAIKIMDAQKSRGMELDKGNFLARAKRFIPVLVPLVAIAITRSNELAEAMESRAYGSVRNPTSLYQLRARNVDVLTATLSIALFGIGLYLYYFRFLSW